MAFSSGSATSQADLITQLLTFATSVGWTVDESVTGAGPQRAAIHRGDCYVQFWFDGTDADNIVITQSLGFTPGNDPGTHPDDSGFKPTSSTSFTNGRRVAEIGNGPFTQHLFFAPNAGGPDADSYIHCALQFAPNLWRHFGFGHLDKIGGWTGGEYAYGHYWPTSGSVSSSVNTLLLDSEFSSTNTTNLRAAGTMHVENLPEMDPQSKWGAFGGFSSLNNLPSDGNGRDVVSLRGGSRGGPHVTSFAAVIANANNAAVPLIPVPAFFRDPTQSPVRNRLLGYMRDVRMMQMRQFSPSDELTLGSDTWVILPGVRKTSIGQQESDNLGIAYRKIT